MLVLASLPGLLAAQSGRSTLSVGVADAESGKPLAGVEIVLPELGLLAHTDSLGQARIPGVAVGAHRVRVRLQGYEASDVELKFMGEIPPVRSSVCTSERPCLVPIFLDNIPLGEADGGMIRTRDLSGAEYYTGNAVPARYRASGTACGALVLWSKWG